VNGQNAMPKNEIGSGIADLEFPVFILFTKDTKELL